MMTMMFLIMVKVVSFPVRDHPSGQPFSELSDHEDDIDVGDVDDDRDVVIKCSPSECQNVCWAIWGIFYGISDPTFRFQCSKL